MEPYEMPPSYRPAEIMFILSFNAEFWLKSTCQFPTKGHPFDRCPHLLAEPSVSEPGC